MADQAHFSDILRWSGVIRHGIYPVAVVILTTSEQWNDYLEITNDYLRSKMKIMYYVYIHLLHVIIYYFLWYVNNMLIYYRKFYL